jgi:hypothetical protein
MRKSQVIIVAVILVIVIAVGSFSWIYFSNQNQDKNKPAAASISVEQIADRSMAYIAANHTGTAQLMQNLPWTGGRQDTGMVGSELYQYISGDWNVTIQYPVVPNPVYTITALYCSQNGTVNWTGTYDGAIIETSQSINATSNLSTQENIRDTMMVYLQAYHNETTSYMDNFSWMGGRMDMGMMVGSSQYSYQSGGWNVTMQSPVVPNPVYNIDMGYTSQGHMQVSWQGTLQNGTVTETQYKYKP